tara:strand:- start:1049 stop:1324 length:276 start_codon:yes stop_codon:yes gene_type:complete
MKSVKIYGSGVKPLSLDLNNKDSLRLKVGSIIKIEDSFFEIMSRIKNRDELFFNVCFFPNPHLYDKLICLMLSKEPNGKWVVGKIQQATAA